MPSSKVSPNTPPTKANDSKQYKKNVAADQHRHPEPSALASANNVSPTAEEKIQRLEEALRREQRRSARAEDSLKRLGERVRGVARQMKQAETADEPCCGSSSATVETVRSSSSLFSEDDDFLSSLAVDEVGRCLAADWMSLQNATAMLIEHARIAGEEASLSQAAQVEAQQWKERALRAEKANKDCQSQRAALKSHVKRLVVERRVLIQEVKSLRHKLAKQEKKGKSLSLNVAGAILLHEQYLAKATMQAKAATPEQLADLSERETPKAKNTGANSESSERVGQTTPPSTPTSKTTVKTTVSEPARLKRETTSDHAIRSPKPLGANLGFGSGVALGFGQFGQRRGVRRNSSNESSLMVVEEQENHIVVEDSTHDHEPVRIEFKLSQNRGRTRSWETFGSRMRQILSGDNDGPSSNASLSSISGQEPPMSSSAESTTDEEDTVLIEDFETEEQRSRSVAAATTKFLAYGVMNIPDHIAFDDEGEQVTESDASKLTTSHASTPMESPHTPSLLGPIEINCDPELLKSLAMPTVER